MSFHVERVASTLGEKLREAIEKKSLATTINQWDDEDNKQTLRDIPVINLTNDIMSSGSTSQDGFDLVTANPNHYTPKSLIHVLVSKGNKQSPTMQMVYALIRRGVYMRDADGRMFTMYADYRTAMKNTQAKNKAKQADTKHEFSDALPQTLAPKRKIVIINKRTGPTVETGGIAALKQEEQTTAPWNAGHLINTLTLMQGRELYLKLKEIFGG